MTWDGKERRARKRFGIKGCTVQYKSAELFGLFSALSPRYLVLNICQEGLHFISREEIPIGKKLILFINAPLLDDNLITVKSRTIWTRKSKEHNAYRTGIVFMGLSQQSKNRLKLILDNALLDKIDLSTRVYLKEVEKL